MNIEKRHVARFDIIVVLSEGEARTLSRVLDGSLHQYVYGPVIEDLQTRLRLVLDN